MSINKSELKILKLIQEKKEISLNFLELFMEKSEITIKRNINNLNNYLVDSKKICIENNNIIADLNYRDYIEFVNSLSINDYIICQEERINLLLVYSYFNNIINLSKIYESIGISLTTKKKDSKELESFLSQKNLQIERIPKKGIKIKGEEKNYRILLTIILTDTFDLDFDNSLLSRKANNPVERMLFNYFTLYCSKEIVNAKNIINSFLEKTNLRISYSSKKFIYIYAALSLYHQKNNYLITNTEEIENNIEIYKIFEDENENKFLNYILASLDYTNGITFKLNEKLENYTKNFIKSVQNDIITTFYNYEKIFNEIYSFLYKLLIRNKLNYNFYDNNIQDTAKIYLNLYNIVRRNIKEIEKEYNIDFTSQQLSTLTLIFRKNIMKNKLLGRNRKKIVIVSNSSVEKLDFFIEILTMYLDIEIVLSININELYLLKEKEYDLIIVFSNRIKTLLEFYGYSSEKINFHINEKDIKKLISLGLSEGKRKISISEFLKDISNRNTDEIKEILLNKYENYFLNI